MRGNLPRSPDEKQRLFCTCRAAKAAKTHPHRRKYSSMVNWRRAVGLWVCACLSMTAAAPLAFPALAEQPPAAPIPNQSRAHPLKERLIPNNFPVQPTVAPASSIPIDALGFSPPGPFYLGSRNTLASLDFIGEDKLLFTFRVPGLMHRSTAGDTADTERQIRAVVLALPSGTVEAQAEWTLHDRARYLWMLNDGRFLLRDRNNLLVGDSSLTLKPYLQFPGPLLWLEMDPAQQYLVADSYEPPQTAPRPGDVPNPSTAAASITTTTDGTSSPNTSSDTSSDASADTSGDATAAGTPDTVVRILRRDTGKVMLVSRVRTTVHLPINSSGYLENLRGQRWQWLLSMSYFQGGSATLGAVDSNCDVTNDFVSEQLILVTGCAADGSSRLVAMTTDGRQLWIDQIPAIAIWPEVMLSPGGLRIARETLGVTHPVNSYSPVSFDDIKGQWLTVYDAATGDMALETPVSPALDAGGNVAISPSGRRVAALNGGSIQIFDLPAPPALPDAGIKLTGR
jgi:hypothetical protein